WYDMVLYYSAHLDWFHRYLGGAPSPYDPKALAFNDVFGKEKDEAKDDAKAPAKDDAKPAPKKAVPPKPEEKKVPANG
ncbi:MAG: hypothetical protein KBB14_05255, partial [Thermoanaerobaculia bacterium]|nr:hypothetical protein [Thermoanaerobaculia bacterium]